MDLTRETEISDALLVKTRIHNYVPATADQEYRTALLREYMVRKGVK